MTDAACPDQIAARLFRLSIGVFFVGGFLSSTVSLFVPRMTLVYGLDYGHALLIQLAFHASYLLFAIPIALAIMRIGYMRSAATGLVVMALSCALLLEAHGLDSYALILVALLALSAGITFLQIASNTVVAVVGDASGSAFRLNFLQAFNAVGTVVAPPVSAHFLLGSTATNGAAAVKAIAPPFLFAISLLAVLALTFTLNRDLLRQSPGADMTGARLDWPRLLRDRRVLAGTAAIFAYTGAEVAIGTLLVNYLVQPQIFGIAPVRAAFLVGFYWGGAMIGRLAGAYAMRWIRPPVLLIFAGAGAVIFVTLAAIVQGPIGGSALLAVGTCNSIMYPTIYVLALPDDPKLATPASTLLCMAVVGGAVVPLATGVFADRVGLATSLALPASCYLLIVLFARACLRTKI